MFKVWDALKYKSADSTAPQTTASKTDNQHPTSPYLLIIILSCVTYCMSVVTLVDYNQLWRNNCETHPCSSKTFRFVL